MKVQWLCGLMVLFTAPLGAGTGERLTMRVTPTVAFAPASVIVQARIESNARNRSIEIIAESADFYRSSELPLDGEKAPRVSRFELRGLPGGRYTVAAVLKGPHEVLALTRQEVNVVETPIAR